MQLFAVRDCSIVNCQIGEKRDETCDAVVH